jgi:RNA polymerase sigma factor FliA
MLHAPIEHEALTYSRNRGGQDVEALVARHGALVRRIAWHVHSRMSTAIEVADLVQIGMIALVEAARTFEDRGLAFTPYASTRIRGAMIDQLRRDARMCRSGMVNRRKIAAVRNQLENSLHRHATESEMAKSMDVDLETYRSMEQASHAIAQESIDDSYSDHDPWFADSSDGPDALVERAEFQRVLAERIGSLSEREALILQLYFVEELNLEEIGEVLAVGSARVCQIKKAALKKLRASMQDWAPSA